MKFFLDHDVTLEEAAGRHQILVPESLLKGLAHKRWDVEDTDSEAASATAGALATAAFTAAGGTARVQCAAEIVGTPHSDAAE